MSIREVACLKQVFAKNELLLKVFSNKTDRSGGYQMGYESMSFLSIAGHREGAKTTTKSLSLLVILITILLSACSGVTSESTANTSADSLEQFTTDVAQPQSPTGTPIAMLTSIELQVKVNANSQYLTDKDNGVYYVELPDEGVDYPAMPTYTWYINGTESDTVGEVVLEFDLIDTVAPLDYEYFGYDRGYYVTLHNFETIPLTPSWWRGSVNNLAKYGDTNKAAMILMPELGVDLQKYVSINANPDGTTHIQITIPYSRFQTASKDLTLQFLPGTTFGNLVAYVQGDGVTPDTIDKITQTIDYDSFDYDDFKEEMLRNFNAQREKRVTSDLVPDSRMNVTEIGNMIEASQYNLGLYVNPDGSVNMHISFYDLGEYADEVQGEYVVVPEGLVSAFFVLNQENGAVKYSYEDKRAVVEVALSMIDENGQFAGIYDISQGKIVATDRKVSALSILSAMLLMNGSERVLTDAEIDSIMNLIIANNILRVDDTLYFAPNGLREDGVMDLALDDFVINGAFLKLMNDYSMNPNRLKKEFGCAMLLEGFANSLQLILEAQEQNETRLPSAEVKVIFSQDGGYELQPSDTFRMEGAYFSMGLASYEKMNGYLQNFRFEDEGVFDSLMKKVASDKDGDYSEKQAQYIREGAAMYSEFYNAYKIINTYYESWIDVYNFVKIQPVSTAYAPGYNVHTGEMISAERGQINSGASWLLPFRERFGNADVSMNWFLIAGMFNDEDMMRNTVSLTMNNYDIYMSMILGSYDYSDPDTYVENGLDLWGYDSLKYVTFNGITATECTRFLFGTSGYSLNREDTDELIRRTLNQFLDDAHQLGPDDAIPHFYDNILRADIAETLGN